MGSVMVTLFWPSLKHGIVATELVFILNSGSAILFTAAVTLCSSFRNECGAAKLWIGRGRKGRVVVEGQAVTMNERVCNTPF